MNIILFPARKPDAEISVLVGDFWMTKSECLSQARTKYTISDEDFDRRWEKYVTDRREGRLPDQPVPPAPIRLPYRAPRAIDTSMLQGIA